MSLDLAGYLNGLFKAQMNGAQMNGVQMNGTQMNGAQMNVAQMNGLMGITEGFAPMGIIRRVCNYAHNPKDYAYGHNPRDYAYGYRKLQHG